MGRLSRLGGAMPEVYSFAVSLWVYFNRAEANQHMCIID